MPALFQMSRLEAPVRLERNLRYVVVGNEFVSMVYLSTDGGPLQENVLLILALFRRVVFSSLLGRCLLNSILVRC